ncbi:MAG: putative peptidyl-prolyl cis-trans isomerase [Alphaproteobacteria bacterium MarineAlpha11_Bin1]|nr:MAG: putative peptidyl-prolyl cis-trans isomerase [Alphaproteobacteria bacterium MarineAlpha11_Bin1]|tara:strand:+ start:3541 stop:4416 length:876 start_codon:yes stop_codon:yes gene_type:complete
MKLRTLAAAFSIEIAVCLPVSAEDKIQGTGSGSDPVVATVDGANIFRSDVYAARTQLPEQYRELPMDQVFLPLVNQLVRSKLLVAKAREENLHESAAYQDRLRLIKDRLLEEALLAKVINARLTDKMLRAKYEDAFENLPSKEEIRARHILVKTESEAKLLVKKLDGGADFAKLAFDNSIGPSKSQGGDLKYFGRGQMVPPFEKAAFALRKGEYTKVPVQSPFGWHVIKIEDKRQSKPPTFEEIRGKLRQDLTQKIITELVDGLIKNAKIERFEVDGSAPRLRRIKPTTVR